MLVPSRYANFTLGVPMFDVDSSGDDRPKEIMTNFSRPRLLSNLPTAPQYQERISVVQFQVIVNNEYPY